MSKVNFLKLEYRKESPSRIISCGIVDSENNTPAYTTDSKSLKWIATINNPNCREFQFVPIDHNIIVFKPDGVNIDSTCDGMILVSEKSMIAFVELKDVRTGGFSDAIGQLKHTVELFTENHQYDIFKCRRAYAANIAHPHFHYNLKDEIEKFRVTHFVLFPQAVINIG
ncbi:hypothetical protein [Pseudobutyrivibrio sp.]|uniref:hypothetical protein n=1 Tax=Pseudobutyrivibrio sp. TaxID=2014367 RepID=UPI00386FD63B